MEKLENQDLNQYIDEQTKTREFHPPLSKEKREGVSKSLDNNSYLGLPGCLQHVFLVLLIEF